MKINDLKNIYSKPPKEFHNSLLRSLNKLEDKTPVRYSKRRKTIKIALACAIIAALGTFTTVASATNLFGLLVQPVGKYGLNIKFEKQATDVTEQKKVNLKLGYVPKDYDFPEGLDSISSTNGIVNLAHPNNMGLSLFYKGDVYSGKEYTFYIAGVDYYNASEDGLNCVVESEETEYNGHQTIVATRKPYENKNEYQYVAVEYFENWGYVVKCVSQDRDELIKIMENLNLEENTNYVEPETENHEYKVIWQSFDNETFSFYEIGESFDLGTTADGKSNALTAKVTSVEERFNSEGLDYLKFNHDGPYNVHDRYFDDNGKLMTPYTREERIHSGDGVNSLDERKDITVDRHFYIVNYEITANEDIENYHNVFFQNILKYENGEAKYSDKGGAIESIYYSDFNDDQKPLKKGETKTLSYGIAVDDDALDITYLNFGTQDKHAHCVKLTK